MQDPVPMQPPGRPRWVKISAIVAGIVVVLAIVITVVSGGEHGPGQHQPGGGDLGSHTPPVEQGP